jgi:hypothetical protein
MAATLLIVHRVVVSNRLRNFAPSNTHTAQFDATNTESQVGNGARRRAPKSWTTFVVNIIVAAYPWGWLLSEDTMTARSRTTADPLGPDSLTWKYFGDLRTGMLGVWIGAIQNMYPELGARTGAQIRGYHETIKASMARAGVTTHSTPRPSTGLTPRSSC